MVSSVKRQSWSYIGLAAVCFVTTWYMIAISLCTAQDAPPSLARGTRAPKEGVSAAFFLVGQLADAISNGQGKPPSESHLATARKLISLLDVHDKKTVSGTPLLGAMSGAARRLAESIVARVDGVQPLGSSSEGDSISSTAGRAAAKQAMSHQPEVRDATDRLYTQQTCYLQTDESEVCTFDNLLCFDGSSPIVTVESPVRDPERILDYSHACMDYRFYEPTSLEMSGCSYVTAGKRDYDPESPMQPGVDFPLSLRMRRWGPNNRNGLLLFKEVHPREIYGDQPERILSAYGEAYSRTELLGSDTYQHTSSRTTGAAAHLGAKTASGDTIDNGSGGAEEDVSVEDLPPEYLQDLSPDPSLNYDTQVLEDKPFGLPGLPGLNIKMRTKTGNFTIDWIDGGVWLAGIDGQWNSNPYHWWSKIGALYDAQRSNKTLKFGDNPRDGYIHWQPQWEIASKPNIGMNPKTHNRAHWRTGAQWELPAMDHVVFAGDGALEIDSLGSLKDWFRSMLLLASQPTSKHYFNDLLQRLDPNHLICMPGRSAIPSAKNKWFTGRADGWLMRQYAYQHAGLAAKKVLPHPKYPPRKVTIVDRQNLNGRGFFNRQELIDAVAATGLPYEVVPNMGSLSFKQQVTLMSQTGILIAPHGAALANMMFLPAHSAVLEFFPYLMKKNTYRHLASLVDLHYFPIYSWETLPPENTQYYGVELMNEMYFWDNCIATNISSYDALNTHACNAASKNYPTVVPIGQLKQVLRDAIDSIGAFSLLNPAWKAVAATEGVPVRPPPKAAQPDEHGING